MQVCTSLQTDNNASTPPLSFYTLDALPAAQPTASKHCDKLRAIIMSYLLMLVKVMFVPTVFVCLLAE